MDTVINVVPSAGISKTHKVTIFSIISKISIFASRNFVRIYLGMVRNHPVQKIGVFFSVTVKDTGLPDSQREII